MDSVIQSHQKERGQSMVELALTITFLMVLLAGTIDMGRAFFTWLALRDAAQEGASYGSIRPNDASGVITRTEYNYLQVIKDPAAHIVVDPIFSGPKCLSNTPSSITVNVDYTNFPLTMPFLGTILGSQTILIHASINDTIIAPTCP
jgi:Flp pilus assembly protein TadG